jgi:hypothetical protein
MHPSLTSLAIARAAALAADVVQGLDAYSEL